MTDWESPETSQNVRKKMSNWTWIALMATHSEPTPSPRQQQYIKGHEALGISIWDYVNYASPMIKTDYVIYRFENFEWGKEYNEEQWKETVRRVDAHAPPDASQKWRNEFQEATGNSPDSHVEHFDFSTLPKGGIIRDENGKKLVWHDAKEGDITDIPDREGGFEYENGNPFDDDVNFDWSGSKNKGIFTVFYLLYDYMDFTYHIYYNLIDKMMGLNKYSGIKQHYDPEVNKDAFVNFYLMVIGYYVSIIGLGIAFRLYKIYSITAGGQL